MEGPLLRKDIHVHPFMEDYIVLVVPAHHPWANQEIDADKLRSAPLLMRGFGSGSRRVVENTLMQAGFKRKDMETRMEFDSTEELRSAVEADQGVGFVSRWAVRNQLTLGTLKIARVRGVTFSRMFSLAYPAGPEPTASCNAFLSFLLTHSLDLAPRVTGRPAIISMQPLRKKSIHEVSIPKKAG